MVGIKGNPEDVNRRVDCDVILAEVRETSRKPDEIYRIIERACPGAPKVLHAAAAAGDFAAAGGAVCQTSQLRAQLAEPR